MSLADVVTRFSTAAADGDPTGYVVTRSTAATYSTTGRVVDGAFSTFLIDACIQPLNGRSLMPLPEGTRTDDVIVVDTSTPLQVIPIPDHITFRDDDYTLFKIDGPRTLNGVSMYTGYAARQVQP